MEPHSLKWVGSPCGLHGPYVFYKAFKFHLEGKPRILSLGDFFFVRCKPGDPICIAELQLLWEERTTKQLLSSSKLYFLPEDTPQGRSVSQGEDEILAVSEKVIVKLDNLVRWTVLDASQWSRGLKAVPLKPSVLKELGKNGRREALHRYCESTLNSGLNFRDVLKEKAQLGEDENDLKRVLVLSYPRYCRYRSVIARLRERPSSLLTDQVVLALGGIASLNGNTRILYCRDTFEHPTLVQNESISDQFAPNLKGRPRKKKPSVSQRQDSQSSAKDISNTDTSAPAKVKSDPKAVVTKLKNGGSGGKKALVEVRAKARTETGQGEEQAFLVSLYQYMKERGTPIERIPYLGFKQIDLWTMFQTAQQLGGYEPITARRQWKNVYDQLGGNPGSTSAATCTRRHYERLLLPYERYIKGEDHQPRPQLQPKPLDRDVLECDGTVKTKEGKQLKITPNRKAPAEVDTFRKSPEPALVADGQESTHPVARATELRRNSLEEDEEEFRLVLKEQTPRCDAMEERTPPTESSSEVRAIGGLSEDLEYLQGYPEPQARGAPDVDLTEAKFSPQFHPSLTHVCAASQSDSRLDPPTATEASVHVGHIPPTLKEKLPLASTDEEQPHPCISCRTVAPPAGTAGIMSPLAKKKLLAQVSGGGVPANSYPFSTPFPAEALGNHNGGSAISRPSVIQHAGNRKRNVTSELFQPDLAPPGPAGGQCQAEKSTGPLFYGSNFPNLHPTHPLLSLHRQGECCLSRDALFSRNGLNGYRFSPNLYSDRTGPGCRPSLTEKPNLPGAEVPSEDQPTDLSLPKSSPPNPPPCQPGLCSLNTPALHRDSPSPLLPATTMDCHPEACCIPTMSVSMPRKLLDAPRPLRKDFVLGHHFVGPVGCGPHQNMFGPHPIRQTMEELDRGPPEKKIRMVAPMHSMQPRTPDTDSNDKLGDRPVGGLKLPARTPLFHPLNPSAQEMCDRSGPATGAGYPLQCLKSQAVVTPLLPPFTLHSLMVQRQLLASATPHLYGPPSGTSYRDFLHHHNLFPMSALTPPPTFTTPQISSLHPSTKL